MSGKGGERSDQRGKWGKARFKGGRGGKNKEGTDQGCGGTKDRKKDEGGMSQTLGFFFFLFFLNQSKVVEKVCCVL